MFVFGLSIFIIKIIYYNKFNPNYAVISKNIFEFADHPLNNIPYTPSEDKVKVYSIPIEKSVKAKPSPKGIIPQPNKLNIKVTTGLI